MWLIWHEMSDLAQWLRNLSSAWPFDDDLILMRPQARATVSCRGHTPTPFSRRAPHHSPLFSSDNDLPALVYRLFPLWFGLGHISRLRTNRTELWTQKKKTERDHQLVNSCDFKNNLWSFRSWGGSSIISLSLQTMDAPWMLCVWHLTRDTGWTGWRCLKGRVGAKKGMRIWKSFYRSASPTSSWGDFSDTACSSQIIRSAKVRFLWSWRLQVNTSPLLSFSLSIGQRSVCV